MARAARTTDVPAVELDELIRTYQSRTGLLRRKSVEIRAVDGVSLSLRRGELFGLLGPNGAGKTTTIKVLTTLLLLVSGANVPLDRLPDWVQTISPLLPRSHGIEAARELVGGQTLAEAGSLLLAEAGIGIAYATAGILLLRIFEFESRRTASLETM